MSRDEGAFWDALPARLLHEAQLWIVEAMLWIDRPLSASDLVKVLDDEDLNVSSTSYHCRRLNDLKVLEFVNSRQVRGAREKFYRLAARPTSTGSRKRPRKP